MPDRKCLIAGLLLALSLGSPAFAGQSAYGDLPAGDKGCTRSPQSEEEVETGAMSMTCPGYKGYKVLYEAADERVSVHYGHLSGRAWASFGPFNSVADRIEWRLDDTGVPRAAIQRYLIANVDPVSGEATAARKGQVLVISRVGQPEDRQGCVVGMVDALANPNANQLARDVADRLVATFRCGEDSATYHGKRGDRSADLSASFDR